MRLSRVTIASVLCGLAVVEAAAVFPNVEPDAALGDDLVVIQDKIQDAKAGVDAELDRTGKMLKDEHDAVTGDKTPAEEEQAVEDVKKRSRSPFESFLMSISMIIASEIGDKTFLVAAIMAMRYPKRLVFSAAFSALALMTVLSGLMGHILPTLLSRRLTQFLASLLFFVFGTKLMIEGLETPKEQGVHGEMAEVEEEISASQINNRNDVESGIDMSTQTETGSSAGRSQGPTSEWARLLAKLSARARQYASDILTPAWVQTFAMTFLGEWGDRSQIATIALAAGSDYIQVILGGIIGHGLCTGMAVVGGNALASKISIRTVLLGGSVAFYVFALTYLYSAYYDIEG